MNVLFNGYNSVDGKDVQFVIQNTGNNTTVLDPLGSPIPAYNFYQEYISQEQWYDITKIVLSTTLLPTNKEYIGFNNGSSNRSIGVLTDFIPYIETGTGRVGRFILEPKVNSWIDLDNSSSLDKIDLNFNWVDRQNNFYPIIIAPGRHLSVKLLFRNKNKLT